MHEQIGIQYALDVSISSLYSTATSFSSLASVPKISYVTRIAALLFQSVNRLDKLSQHVR